MPNGGMKTDMLWYNDDTTFLPRKSYRIAVTVPPVPKGNSMPQGKPGRDRCGLIYSIQIQASISGSILGTYHVPKNRKADLVRKGFIVAATGFECPSQLVVAVVHLGDTEFPTTTSTEFPVVLCGAPFKVAVTGHGRGGTS
ncbi:hypothetical protein PG984_002259 [Apiospora sp. TS-2023a]